MSGKTPANAGCRYRSSHPIGVRFPCSVAQCPAHFANKAAMQRHVRASHEGLRVVTGQRLIQAASDLFLGWSEGPKTGRHYYVRQLWDAKGQGDPGVMEYENLAHYAKLCGWALARAHARTGDPVMLSGYLGKRDVFDQAIAEWAVRYADQTVIDHETMVQAIRDGRIEAIVEVDR